VGRRLGVPGKRQIKMCCLIQLALRPDPPAVPLNDASHIGQPQAEAFELRLEMEMLEDFEQPFGIPGFKSDAIVAHAQDDFVPGAEWVDTDKTFRCSPTYYDRSTGLGCTQSYGNRPSSSNRTGEVCIQISRAVCFGDCYLRRANNPQECFTSRRWSRLPTFLSYSARLL